MKAMKNSISSSSSDVKQTTSYMMQNNISVYQYDEVASVLSNKTRYSEAIPTQQFGILSVAQWFLNREKMSHKKLQKLCYYAYAWFLVFFNDQESLSSQLNTLCSSGFEAWVHGPVCPDLYRFYRNYGWEDIPAAEKAPEFPSDVEDLLNQVWNTYGSFTADQLEQLTHIEAPWQKAREGMDIDEPSNKKIDERIVFEFYSKMMTQ